MISKPLGVRHSPIPRTSEDIHRNKLLPLKCLRPGHTYMKLSGGIKNPYIRGFLWRQKRKHLEIMQMSNNKR